MCVAASLATLSDLQNLKNGGYVTTNLKNPTKNQTHTMIHMKIAHAFVMHMTRRSKSIKRMKGMKKSTVFTLENKTNAVDRLHMLLVT